MIAIFVFFVLPHCCQFFSLTIKKILNTAAPCYAMLLEELVVLPDLDTDVRVFEELLVYSYSRFLNPFKHYQAHYFISWLS